MRQDKISAINHFFYSILSNSMTFWSCRFEFQIRNIAIIIMSCKENTWVPIYFFFYQNTIIYLHRYMPYCLWYLCITVTKSLNVDYMGPWKHRIILWYLRPTCCLLSSQNQWPDLKSWMDNLMSPDLSKQQFFRPAL